MCLIFVALNKHSDYPMIVAANRDEFFHRSAKPLHKWDNGIIAGKDIEAGGTWLGISPKGKFAALTNFRDPAHKVSNPVSRGKLVSVFLENDQAPLDYLQSLESQQHRYEGFNLLLGQHSSLWYFSNRQDQGPIQLSPGNYGLSNHLLDTPWPKVATGKEDFQSAVSSAASSTVRDKDTLINELFKVMYNRSKASDDQLPSTGVGIEIERYLSSRFIQTPLGRYGTRCSTVLLLSKNDSFTMNEITWDKNGQASSGQQQITLDIR